MASRPGLDPREVTPLVLGMGGWAALGEDKDAVIQCTSHPEYRTGPPGLQERECIFWAQSGEAAWVRRQLNWTEREEQDLDG